MLTRNGEVVAEGRSDAVLGNPVTAVAWLARKVDHFGVRLKAGDIVLPGSCTRAIDARPGDDFVADFDGLGSVRSVVRIARSQAYGSNKATVAIVGSGNISTDLLYKLLRSEWLEPRWMIGIDPESEGLARARKLGLETSHEGVDWLLALDEKPDLVFEATSAYVHRDAAPRYAEAGIRAIDLTPAAVGPGVIPPANLREHLDAPNVNMVTCGGQATIPMVYAVSRVVDVPYAEIVASVSSASAGPGTRANIDEFTKTTSAGVEDIGGAKRGKAIIILNPADPPMIMRDTIFCAIPEDADQDAITAVDQGGRRRGADLCAGLPAAQRAAVRRRRRCTPAAKRWSPTFVEVEGAGDYLPPYAGNLDIMTAAATKVGEEIAKEVARRPPQGGQA